MGRASVIGAAFGIGGELDVDVVGFVDDVIVGDDVAARVDDEAGAESLVLAAAWSVAVIGVLATLAAKEAVEAVPFRSPSSPLPGSPLGWPCCAPCAERRLGDCCGSVMVLMFTTAGPTCLGDPGKFVRQDDGAGNGERARVGGVDGLLLGADGASEDGACEDPEGERGQQREGCGEADVGELGQERLREACGVSMGR